MKRRTTILIAWAALSLLCITIGGCYRHVVKQSGPGAEHDVYEPNVSEEESNDPS